MGVSLVQAFCCVVLMLYGGAQATNIPPAESDHALPVDDLRDLLLASMQNTISLTELATQQTSKISKITTSLNEARTEVEQLRSKINKLEEGQTEQNENLSGTKTDIEGLKNDLATSQGKIEILEEGQSELAAQVGDPSWPEGSYCILASGDCPADFTRHYGHIKAFNTYSYNTNYIQPAAFGDSYMRCHGPCGQHTSWDAEFAITSCCK